MEWNGGMNMRMVRTSCELSLESSYSVTSQVTKSGRGSAECLMVVTDRGKTDQDTKHIECIMAFPVKVVPREIF